jgi:hypothetical protein
MAISLLAVNYDSSQDPVGVDRPFTVRLSLRASSSDPQRSATVKLWTEAAYAVAPRQVTVEVPVGSDAVDRDVSIQLQGTPEDEIVRIYAECDERHSVSVRVQ